MIYRFDGKPLDEVLSTLAELLGCAWSRNPDGAMVVKPLRRSRIMPKKELKLKPVDKKVAKQSARDAKKTAKRAAKVQKQIDKINKRMAKLMTKKTKLEAKRDGVVSKSKK